MRAPAAFLCLLLGLAPLPAQIAPGDIGVTGFSSSQFSVIDVTGAIQSYSTSTFGSGTSQSILWDQFNAQSFIVGGLGFVGRATITGPGSMVWTPILPGASAAQLSWDPNGFLVVADPSADQVLRVDTVLNTSTVLVPSGPWGTTLNAGAVDPASGDVVVGGQGGIWRIPAGTTNAVPVWNAFGTAYVSGITFDPVTGDVVASILTVGRLVRIDAQGVVTDIIAPGTQTFNSVAYDTNGDIIAGGTNGTVYRIPNAGGSLTPLGTPSGQSNNASGVAVVGMATGPTGPQYQLNQAGATLTVNSVIGTVLMPATVTVPAGGPMPNVVITSTASGTLWDVGVGTAPLRSFSQGVLSLPDGQFLNLDLADPSLELLWGGFQSPPFANVIGVANVSGPQSLSLQAVIVDPVSVTGVSISQPVRLVLQ